MSRGARPERETSSRPERGESRWRDRVELSLDGRQIFFLFFGSAVVACVLFASGVLVGRRIEQRAAVPVAGDDPLAALDQLDNTDSDDGLTFPAELVHGGKRSARDNTARPAPRSSPRADEAHPAAGAGPVNVGSGAANPSVLPAPPVVLPPAPGAAAHAAPAAASAGHPPSASGHATAPAGPASPTAAKPNSGRFALQLSSFADRGDAEAFASKVSAGGIPARVVESKVEGKGTFYRVRAGDYATRQAANDAKAAYDRSHSDPAMVAPE